MPQRTHGRTQLILVSPVGKHIYLRNDKTDGQAEEERKNTKPKREKEQREHQGRSRSTFSVVELVDIS